MSKEQKTVIGEIKSLMVKFGFLKSEDFLKLVDGTEIKLDGDLAEGVSVMVVTEDSEIAAPDGTHELEDGAKIVTEGGIIMSVELPEVEEMEDAIDEEAEGIEQVEMEDEVIEVEVPGVLPAEVAAPAVEAIVEAIVPLLEKVKSLEEELTKVKASFESFKKEAAGAPVNKNKKDFKSHDKDELVNKILALKKAYK
jgi:hypothetical protein